MVQHDHHHTIGNKNAVVRGGKKLDKDLVLFHEKLAEKHAMYAMAQAKALWDNALDGNKITVRTSGIQQRGSAEHREWHARRWEAGDCSLTGRPHRDEYIPHTARVYDTQTAGTRFPTTVRRSLACTTDPHPSPSV